jgi:succinate dehydrogenase / fumarate reductase cytochrome b subunit
MHGYWGSITTLDYDGKPTRDLYTLVDMWFQKEWYVGLYVFCMGALAFHLWHGFSSAFQTLGMNHLKYNNLIAIVGRAYAIIIPALFALIPIMMYLKD